jgi:hypothetical protein
LTMIGLLGSVRVNGVEPPNSDLTTISIIAAVAQTDRVRKKASGR